MRAALPCRRWGTPPLRLRALQRVAPGRVQIKGLAEKRPACDPPSTGGRLASIDASSVQASRITERSGSRRNAARRRGALRACEPPRRGVSLFPTISRRPVRFGLIKESTNPGRFIRIRGNTGLFRRSVRCVHESTGQRKSRTICRVSASDSIVMLDLPTPDLLKQI